MSNKPFFSIITPVFNAEENLEECIKSVIDQTYTSWELILVDDGSSDSSGDICDRFANLDARIRVVHKENGGEFSARFKGIESAIGEYVTGLDSDDYFVSDYLETIYTVLKNNKYDCLMWSYTMFGEKSGRMRLPDNCVGDYSGKEFLRLVVGRRNCAFWNKAIRREILQSVDYTSTPKVKMAEDYIMVIPALCHVISAAIIDYYGYMYRVRSDSTSHMTSFAQVYDLCEVSSYGSMILDEYDSENDLLIRAEKTAFLRSTFPRIIKLIKYDRLSFEQLKLIQEHPAYVSASMEEKIKNFGLKYFIYMNLFRHDHIKSLRFLLGINPPNY